MLNVIELEYITPPVGGSIFGVPIANTDDALELYKWAKATPDFTCTLTTRLDGAEHIQIEGRTASTVTSIIGGDRWIVFDNGQFTVFQTAAAALTIYKVKN